MPYVPLSSMQRGFARIVAAHGQPMTLKRSGEADLSVTGKRLLLRIGDEAVGNSQQTRFRVKIGTAELAASSWANKVAAIGDFIVVDGRTCNVLDVWPIEHAGSVALYELEVAG